MTPLTDLKSILHSKRANIYYLEFCRVMQKDGRVLYLTQETKENLYYNIPIANTTCILLGIGTSITQSAMRMLASAGVLVGFSGGGGTPLLMGNEIEWMTPQSEYRPTEYVQGWLSWWWDESKRLNVAKHLQGVRIGFIETVWSKDNDLNNAGFNTANVNIKNMLNVHKSAIKEQSSVSHLLQLEARLTKQLYKLAVNNVGEKTFKRIHQHNHHDKANAFLNHGNYLAYGLGATTTWVLGIPHGFAVMHGKTRRGALVFDIADLIKDAIVLPLAFICASENATEQTFRQECLRYFAKYKALDFMFEQVKSMALQTPQSLGNAL